MTREPRWRVSFSGPLNDAAKGDLAGVDADYEGTRQGEHSATIEAPNAEAAVSRIRRAVDPHGAFSGFAALPLR
jgi:hypothetical protein